MRPVMGNRSIWLYMVACGCLLSNMVACGDLLWLTVTYVVLRWPIVL
jgi:hypothetical protein